MQPENMDRRICLLGRQLHCSLSTRGLQVSSPDGDTTACMGKRRQPEERATENTKDEKKPARATYDLYRV